MGLGDAAEALGEQLARDACDGLTASADLSSRLFSDVSSVEQAVDLYNGFAQGLCGGDPPVSQSDFLPFEGGQCAAPYDLQFFGGDCTPSGNPSPNGLTLGEYAGPISNVQIEFVRDAPTGSCNNQQEFNVIVDASTGTFTDTLFGVPPIEYNLVRADGGPDDCGDPDPELPTPGPVTINNSSVTYNDYQDNSVTQNFDLELSPAYVDLDGEINLPFKVSGDFNLEGDLRIDGDVNFNFDGGGGSPVDPDGDVPPNPEPGEEDPEEGRIIAVVTTANGVAAGRTEIFPTNGPTIVAPRLGLINFVYSTGGSIAYSPDIPIKNRRQWTPVPGGIPAVGVLVSPEPGVTVQTNKIVAKGTGSSAS